MVEEGRGSDLQSAQVISLDIYKATKQLVNISDEPEECEPTFHRFRNIRRLNDETTYCELCGCTVKLQSHPSINVPLYTTE